MSFLRIALGLILRFDVGFGQRSKQGVNDLALCARHPPLTFTLLSFSSATQRQFAGEPAG